MARRSGLTAGAGNETGSVRVRLRAYHEPGLRNPENRWDIWSLPVRNNPQKRYRPSGEYHTGRPGPPASGHRCREMGATPHLPPISRGSKPTSGYENLTTGKESIVAGSPFQQNPMRVSNAAGSRIAYGVYEKDKQSCIRSRAGWERRRSCVKY